MHDFCKEVLLCCLALLQSDWQPDLTSVSTSEQASNIDDKTANDANTEVSVV